jgi:hypothetical protein
VISASTGAGQYLSNLFRKEVSEFLDAGNHRHVRLSWIPHDFNIRGCQRAFKLARVGSRDPDSCLEWSGTLCHRNRLIREKTLEDWREIWADMPRASLYHISDRLPPTFSFTWQIKHLPRRLCALVLHCRTGHGSFGEYFARRVPDEDVNCPCGVLLQTREHILQSCERYEAHRHILRQISPTIDLPVILGTLSGIKALSKFIAKTGAFSKGGEEVLEVEEDDEHVD